MATLTDAVAKSVTAGLAELDRLDVLVTEVESRLQDAWREISSYRPGSAKDQDGFFVLLDTVVDDLRGRLGDSRRAVSTFNVAFFGRTGAGKSTLLSTLGGLNGELVSDGRSDFTVDVRPLDWQGCRLYDTPGINGWGRTRPRADLEEAAREAVELADVVLLCFDSQSQQASEFVKVAAWVRAYRKPVIATLNVRNPMWRHPARVASRAQREGLSRTVQQHADNIAGELEAIGLHHVPIVAMHSKRGLFARASTPFAGPAATELVAERSAYGLEYLDRMSNLPVFEKLLEACIVEGAADLRLAALREGLQAGLRDWADAMDLIGEEHLSRGKAIEGVIAEGLTILGYPDAGRRQALLLDGTHSDFLELLEAARGEPFTAPASGRLETHVRHLLKSHLSPQRAWSLRSAEQLIMDAFETQRQVLETEFESAVFDSNKIARSIEIVGGLAADFLAENLDIARVDASIDLDLIDRTPIAIHGKAGIGRRRAATVLKAGGLLGSGTGAVLGVVALTQWWNPAGWTAAAILGGLGIASVVLGLFGKRARKRAEAVRADTRARAVADARASVNAFFDQCENQHLAQIINESWAISSPLWANLLAQALHIRIGCRRLAVDAAWLRNQAADQPPVPSPAEVIGRASDRVLAGFAWNPPNLRALLLGEDWVQEKADGDVVGRLSEADLLSLRDGATANHASFTSLLGSTFGELDTEAVDGWLSNVAGSSALDPAARDVLRRAASLLSATPKVVLLGDYSSGKTSLIKRLLAEAGVDVPRSLKVNARAATSTPTAYGFGSMELVDAPGFQSGNDEHDSLALTASEASALTVVVLHVNLLIGDTFQLERLLHGDGAHVGKARTTIFIIGRSDELGVDPVASPREFLVRRNRKVDELLGILDSRDLRIERNQVLVLAADPYGLVGDAGSVSAADYSADDRMWDGVSSLCAPLLGADNETLSRMSASSALDLGRSALLAALERARAAIDDIEAAQAATERLEKLLETSSAELTLLRLSVEQRIARAIGDHANEILAEALGAGPDDVETLSKRLQLWHQDPRLVSAMTSLEPEIERDLSDWTRRHASEFEREARRLKFTVDTSDFNELNVAERSGLKDGIRAAGEVTRHAGNMVKGAGTRDAVYAIVKTAGGKFKPWGAVKLGAKVAKAGAVLGVLAVGFDIADWVIDRKKEEKREDARMKAAEYVRETKAKVVREILGQPDGPVEALKSFESELDKNLADLRIVAEEHINAYHETCLRLDTLTSLLDAGDALAARTATEVTT